MSSYQELEYGDWPLVQKDPALRAAIEGIVSAGQMLHTAFDKNFESGRFVKQPNPEAYIVDSERLMAEAIRRTNPEDPIIGKTIDPNADYMRGRVWLENGIDGFANFASGIRICDVMVAQVEDGRLIRSVVYDFLSGSLYYAARDEGSYINGQQLTIPNVDMSESSLISYAPLVVRSGRGDSEDANLVSAVWRGMERISTKYGQHQRELQAGGLELCWVAEGRLHGYLSSWSSKVNLGPGVLIVLEAGGNATHPDGSMYIPSNKGALAGPHKIYRAMRNAIKRYLPK